MVDGEAVPSGNGSKSRVGDREPSVVGPPVVRAGSRGVAAPEPDGWVIETIVSPFHCLYQDALEFHTLSQLRVKRSVAESSRLARASLLLYLASAEALVHQAAVELGRPGLSEFLADPSRPMPLEEVWRLLPCVAADGEEHGFDPGVPPWPQFVELLALRRTWAYPGRAAERRAYYRAARQDADFEPLDPRDLPPGLGFSPSDLAFPRTGLPRDPYALRPHHLDAARSVLDAAIAALDHRLGGALTRDARHRREPVRVVHPRQG